MPCKLCSDYGWEIPGQVIYTDESGLEYCVFHAPHGYKGVCSDGFNKIVFEYIFSKQNCGICCNLSGTIFPGDIDFHGCECAASLPQLNFSKAVFCGKTNFKNCKFLEQVEFGNVYFRSDVNFLSSEFQGIVYIVNSEFEGGLSFDKCIFYEIFDLSGISVKNILTAHKAVFHKKFDPKWLIVEGYVSFCEANFMDEVSLSGAVLNGMTSFEEAIFHKNFTITESIVKSWSGFFSKRSHSSKHVEFNSKVIFNKAKFYNDIVVSMAVFNDDVMLCGIDVVGSIIINESRFLSNLNFTGSMIGKDLYCFNDKLTALPEKGELLFDRCIIRGEVRIVCASLKNFIPNNIDLSKFRFESCVWKYDQNGNMYIFLVDESTDLENIRRYELEYRVLKKKAIDDHDEMMASAWHYQEKCITTILLSKKQCKNFHDKLLSIFLCLYKICSGYGEDPAKAIVALMSLILAIFIFVFSSYIYDVGMESYEISWSGLCSVIESTFKLALFMDAGIKSVNIFSAVALIFSRVLLPIQAALFALSLRNKLRR